MDKIVNYKRKPEDDYYYIIGCDELSNEDQIITEYKARVLSCHPDKHPNDPEAAECFARLQKAKEVLTDPNTKANYDKWRNSGVAMDFDEWCSLRNSVHVSMHWRNVKTKPMLQEGESSLCCEASKEKTVNLDKKQQKDMARSTYQKYQPKWERDQGSHLLQKFRNYDI